MADYLKQRDVDPVMAGALPQRPVLAPLVTPFALTGPPPLAGWIRAALLDAQEALAPALGAALSSLMGTPFELTAAPPERVTGRELSAAVGMPCAAFALTAAGAPTPVGFLALELDLAYFLVERLLGGGGGGAAGVGGGTDFTTTPAGADGEPAAPRTLTRLEQLLLEDVAQRVLTPVTRIAGRALGITPSLGAFEGDLGRFASVAADEPFLALAFEVANAGPRSYLTFAWGMKALGAAAATVATAPTAAPATTAAPARREHPDLARALLAARVTMRARLPQFRLRARSVLALAEGQVIDTGHDADAPLELLVNERPRYRGTIGRVRRRLGVRVGEPWSPEPTQATERLREGRVL